MNPHQVTRDFEAALCRYTGAPYAVAVNSCTMALTLAVAWHTKSPFGFVRDELDRKLISIPKRTYVSVPMAIIHAGGRPVFRDEDWLGSYQLKPLPVWDSARRFTSGMYQDTAWQYANQSPNPPLITGGMLCLSFHASKVLGIEQGGAILHDDADADEWLRRARFDGRTEGVAPANDRFDQIGWHCYINPSTAAQGLLKLHSLPQHNAPLPNDPYPDLSTFEIFR